MTTILPYLLGAAMLATVGVLTVGIISFAFNTQLNERYGNKLMVARVVLQGVAIALFALLVLVNVP